MLYAQNLKTDTKRYIEKSINGQTYVYDTLTQIIQNKNNNIYQIVEAYHCEFGVGKFNQYNYIFDKVFSAERKQELKGNTLLMIFQCDSLGNVLEVQFKSNIISQFTLQEIYILEKSLLKHKIEIVNPCPEKKYYLVVSAYHGWRK
ncbi:hypothetical protein AGMMS50262_17100 [Bacteroidia bacterium]|nr:hypothetical protein AGMMS50262_17100 [Bacteroidia bacterium]